MPLRMGHRYPKCELNDAHIYTGALRRPTTSEPGSLVERRAEIAPQPTLRHHRRSPSVTWAMAYQTFRAAAAVELEDELSESAQLAELALLTPDSDSADLQRQHEPVSAGSGATTAQRTHASATHKSSKQTNKLATVHASKEKKNKAQPSATQPESARAAKQSRLTPSHKSAACSRVPQSPPATPRAQGSAAAGAAAEPNAAVTDAAMPSSSSGEQSPRGQLAPPRAHATADEQEKHKGKSQAKKKKKSKSNNNSSTNNMAARESAPVDAASGSEADDPFAGTQSQDAGDQMSEVSEDDFDDDAMRGAWCDIFKAAEQRAATTTSASSRMPCGVEQGQGCAQVVRQSHG